MYIGAGAGIVLFAVFGLLPGSFLGGVMGLSISGAISGGPATPGILSRIIVSLSMLTGVLASGLLFTVAGSTIGWLVGVIADAIRNAGSVEAPDEHSSKV